MHAPPIYVYLYTYTYIYIRLAFPLPKVLSEGDLRPDVSKGGIFAVDRPRRRPPATGRSPRPGVVVPGRAVLSATPGVSTSSPATSTAATPPPGFAGLGLPSDRGLPFRLCSWLGCRCSSAGPGGPRRGAPFFFFFVVVVDLDHIVLLLLRFAFGNITRPGPGSPPVRFRRGLVMDHRDVCVPLYVVAIGTDGFNRLHSVPCFVCQARPSAHKGTNITNAAVLSLLGRSGSCLVSDRSGCGGEAAAGSVLRTDRSSQRWVAGDGVSQSAPCSADTGRPGPWNIAPA